VKSLEQIVVENAATRVRRGSGWQRRPCEGCGFVRRVLVHYAPEFPDIWNKFCEVCDLRARAMRHKTVAARFERRANAIEEARAPRHRAKKN